MRIGQKDKGQSNHPDPPPPGGDVVADVTRTWHWNVARYARLEEPFAVMLMRLDEVRQHDKSVEIEGDALLDYLRRVVRVEDDVYALGESSLLTFMCNVDLAVAA